MRLFPANTQSEIGYHVATLGLGPVLVVQGVRARRSILRLDEPAGARSGSEGSGPALRLLIAGDSAAAGVGAATQHEALSGQLAAQLGSGFHVSWKLIAQTGLTVRDVIGRLEATAPERFDVALISVGVNDVTGRTRSTAWIRRLKALIGLLESRFGVEHILLSSLPPMHVFPALPQPLRWYLGYRARQLDAMIRTIAAADARCEYLPIDFPFEQRYMAADGFHPGAPAYRAWASAAAHVIRRRIGTDRRD